MMSEVPRKLLLVFESMFELRCEGRARADSVVKLFPSSANTYTRAPPRRGADERESS